MRRMTAEVKQLRKRLLFIGISSAVFLQNIGFGECLSKVSGPIAFKMRSCSPVDPKSFDTRKPQYKFIGDLDPAGRDEFYKSYQGHLLSGTVLFSQADRKGDLPEKGVLKGQQIQIFLPESLGSCEKNFPTNPVGIVIDEVCCNGTGNAPCLLETGFVTKGFSSKILEKSTNISPPQNNKKVQDDPETQNAIAYFQQKKFPQAAGLFEKQFKKKQLDVHGLLLMAQNYYAMDQCSDALRPLSELRKLQEADKIWLDDQKYARIGLFLTARCYSKMNKPQKAVLYLNGFLLEPEKYQPELRESLKHKDFGWIHTSAEFLEYKKQAELKLKKIKPVNP